MDEYEVDLIDYLRVMWKGKWIILGCLVVAVAVSAAVMWTRPNEFSGTTSYRVYQSLSVFGISDLDKQEVVNTVLDFQATYKDAKLALTAESNDDRVQVTLTGTIPPADLTQAFGRLAVSVEDQLKEYVGKEVAQTVLSTSMHINQLIRQRDALKAQIDALDSPTPDDALLGYLAFGYLAQKTADLEAQLIQDQVKLEALNNTDPTSLFTIDALGEPVISQIGPNRKMSLAVAGVLGLFVGVLLAFFVHYLVSARERESTHKQA